MKDLLKQAFDPESFRESGHQLIDQLADLLIRDQHREGKVTDVTSPEHQYDFWRDYQIETPHQFYEDVIKNNIQLHHPRYIGHQVSSPAPMAALSGLLSDFLNVGMGVFEMGEAGTAIEKVVTDEFCKTVGYGPNSDGFLTSGGTLANLTALLAARYRSEQLHPNKEQYILVSEQAHYCVDRAASTMGLATNQVIKIQTDDQFAMSIQALKEAVEKYTSNDSTVMAIIGSACTTATGTYDDLETIAEICHEHKIWMHVDGAHGGAALWTSKYKHLLKYARYGDSIVIDAHKMMLVPALATAVLFKESGDSYKTFHQEASYLFEKADEEWYNLAKRTYETTKYMIGIKIFIILRYHGTALLDQYITRQYDLTTAYAKCLAAHSNFEIAHEPMANILCFRFLDTNLSNDVLNKLNIEIRKKILQEGQFYIVQTILNGNNYLRVTIMNPATTIQDLEDLNHHICDIAKGLTIQNS